MSKVLVIDDEKSIRVTLCEFLHLDGFIVEGAADANEAYEKLNKEDYDVIITDIIMPRESGLEILTKIREKSANVQVIVMTGEPTVDTAINAIRNGANDYLIKPINKMSLLQIVRKAAQIKSLYDEKRRLENENQRYQKELEELVANRTHDLQSAMQSIVILLSSVVDVRDPYTAGHQRKVGNLAATIAQKLNLSNKKIDLLRIIGYIHDIGKIVIPAEILSKPGKLSLLEMEMIRNHPSLGYEMLRKVNLPDLIAETVYQHHERCDGSGYPRSLKAKDIILEAQIIIVADVVEAMMSHRPYRPALGIETALNEIRENAGKLYHPEVVKACIEMFESDGYAIEDVEYKINFPL